MVISNVLSKIFNNVVRWQAQIEWENNPIKIQELYFESKSLKEGPPNPLCFLLAMLPQAWWTQEKRICINAEIPQLYINHFLLALGRCQEWHAPDKSLPVIEYQPLKQVFPPSVQKETGLFLSGGVDSMALLAENHTHYPENDLRRARHAIFVNGFDMNRPGKPPQNALFRHTMDQLVTVTKKRSIQFHEIKTNLRHKKIMHASWPAISVGFALAAVAVCFEKYLSCCMVASDYSAIQIAPYGSHPLIIPLLGTSELKLKLGQLNYTRQEKLVLLSNHPDLLNKLRVCYDFTTHDNRQLNCSECHKCTMTMLGLLAEGMLGFANQFSKNDLKPHDLNRIKVRSPGSNIFLIEIEQRLREIGRIDLADALIQKIARNTRTGRRRKVKRKIAQWFKWVLP